MSVGLADQHPALAAIAEDQPVAPGIGADAARFATWTADGRLLPASMGPPGFGTAL